MTWLASAAARDGAFIGGAASKISAGSSVANPTANIYTAGKATLLLSILLDPTTPMIKDSDGVVLLRRPGGASWVNYDQNTLAAGTAAVCDVLNLDEESIYDGTVGTTAAATPATVADTNAYPIADQDGNNFSVDVTGQASQTVNLSGVTTDPEHIAAQANTQLVGLSASVVGGQVVYSSDRKADGVTISASAGTSALTFGTPVAATGADWQFTNGVTWDAAAPIRTNAVQITQPASV